MKETSTIVFYSNIEKLLKIIDTCLDKGQNKNAEIYINYFFESIIKFYNKISNASKIKYEIIAAEDIQTEYNSRNITKSINILPERSIQNFKGDFFSENILKLLDKNIKPNRFDIFHFVMSKLKDSIIILLKNDKTKINAKNLLRQYKHINDKVFLRKDMLGKYEQNLFTEETFTWFIEIYSNSQIKTEDIEIIKIEILYILKYFIDNNYISNFERFLNRIYSSQLYFHFFKPHDIEAFKIQDKIAILKIKSLINQLLNTNFKLLKPDEFKLISNEIELKLMEELNPFAISEEDVIIFKRDIKNHLLLKFKEEYIRVVLVKAIVYSIFMGKKEFVEKFISYNQPVDSDSFWVNTDYSQFFISDIFILLEKSEDLILNDSFFFIDHHGFKIYLNQLIASLLSNYTSENIIKHLDDITDYNKAVNIENKLIELKNSVTNNSNILNSKHSKEIIEIWIERLKFKISQLDQQEIIKQEIDYSIYQNFKDNFITSFYNTSIFRNLFKRYNCINTVENLKDESSIGINQILPKKAFIKQNQITYLNLHDFFAQRLAENENISILYIIENKCETNKLNKIEFEDYLKINKQNFDIIISKGNYFLKEYLPNVEFEESWTFESSSNKIPNFIGKVDKHYDTFLINTPSNEGFILLNSTKLPVLNQYQPPNFKNSEQQDIFNFSLIDFKTDQESLKKHSTDPTQNGELLMNVWLRIYQSYDISFTNDFNGVFIEIL